MEWKSNLITGLQWSDRIINREGKERIAVSYTHLTLPTNSRV